MHAFKFLDAYSVKQYGIVSSHSRVHSSCNRPAHLEQLPEVGAAGRQHHPMSADPPSFATEGDIDQLRVLTQVVEHRGDAPLEAVPLQAELLGVHRHCEQHMKNITNVSLFIAGITISQANYGNDLPYHMVSGFLGNEACGTRFHRARDFVLDSRLNQVWWT